MAKKPRYPYSVKLVEAIDAILPEDTPYIFIAAHYRNGEESESDVNVISTEDDNAKLAASLRAIARKIQGDS